jgi:phage terminase large subunit GpA-like protein
MTLQHRLTDILDFSAHRLSDVLPHEWAEKKMRITSGNFPGPLSYDRTPFTREIIDCLSPYHPATEVALMGGAQFGKSKTVIEPAIAFYISEHPCDIGYLTGHTDLSEEAMDKLDSAIDNSGLRPLIRKQSLGKRNTRTGDTLKSKEFPLGSLVSGSATNHKLLRQRSWKVIFADDIEAAKGASKESGSTVALIRERAKSFGKKKKIFWCSTPELEQTSIIKPLFLSGDQRYYHIPCPCCSTAIVIKWSVPIDGTDDKGGITWKLDSGNRLIPNSVGYICQSCGGFFNDRNKWEFNLAGKWIATAVPEDPNMVSFHLSSLYATPGMNDWEQAVRDYLKANPPGQPQNEHLMKTFVNLTLGETFVSVGEVLKATAIMDENHVRGYAPGTVPEKTSIRDGNGRIVLLTCAVDLNGKQEDGRLDYQVIGWAENGANYNIIHGSIGTFKPAILKRKGDELEDRQPWTYEENKPFSIWPEFEKVLMSQFTVDAAIPRTMGIIICALDTGKTFNNLAYTFIDKMNNRNPGFIQGVKGRADDYYSIEKRDATLFRRGKEREDLWILETGVIKDYLKKNMNLNWNDGEAQPSGYMNFPRSNNGLYEWGNFFSHFESEKPVVVATAKGLAKVRWEKVQSNSQNHQWDCMVYNMAIKDILIEVISKRYNIKDYSWAQYVANALHYYATNKL